MTKNPFRYFKTSPKVIQVKVMMYVHFPLSLRNVEDLLPERGIDVCHESVRPWVDRFGPIFAGKIRTKRASFMRQHTQWQWHLDEIFVKINSVQHYIRRAVDYEAEMLESYVTKTRDKQAALTFLKAAMSRFRRMSNLQKFVSHPRLFSQSLQPRSPHQPPLNIQIEEKRRHLRMAQAFG